MLLIVIVLGMFGCKKEPEVEVMTTCKMTLDSGTEITHRLFYTGKVATKMQTTSKVDLALAFKKSYEKAFTATDKERFGESVVTEFNMIDGEDWILTTYDLNHEDAHMIFEYYIFYRDVDVKNKDGSYSSKKILDALKNYEDLEVTCDD